MSDDIGKVTVLRRLGIHTGDYSFERLKHLVGKDVQVERSLEQTWMGQTYSEAMGGQDCCNHQVHEYWPVGMWGIVKCLVYTGTNDGSNSGWWVSVLRGQAFESPFEDDWKGLVSGDAVDINLRAEEFFECMRLDAPGVASGRLRRVQRLLRASERGYGPMVVQARTERLWGVGGGKRGHGRGSQAAEVVAAVPPRAEGVKETPGTNAGAPISHQVPGSLRRNGWRFTPAGTSVPAGFEQCSKTLSQNQYTAPEARQGGNDGADVLLYVFRAGGRVRAHGVRAVMRATAVLHPAAPRRRDAVLKDASRLFAAVKWTNCAPTAQSERIAIQTVERTMRKTGINQGCSGGENGAQNAPFAPSMEWCKKHGECSPMSISGGVTEAPTKNRPQSGPDSEGCCDVTSHNV
ncbi:MAG: hypothetical protein P8011_01510 [Acidihalobacter sp.]|uniref:hypothetical protein n=1 Tax=Acidihalobacter sp. TaxID=1872108 RepID=UPI00307F74A8